MHARTNDSPPADTVKAHALKLASLLTRAGLNVAVGRDGTIEVRNPRDSRMTQSLILCEHHGALWLHWVWSGPTRDAPAEYEPMVPADDVEEAARRIVNVLRIEEPPGASR